MDNLVDGESLKDFVRQVFIEYGFSSEHSEIASEVLNKADLRGIDSHGVARLTGYLRLIEAGRLNPKPKFKFTKEYLSGGTIDADSGVGLVSAQFAMKRAIEKAEKTGCAFIGVSNSNHFGIAGAHSELAIKHGMIGWAMTNASPLVAPFGSKKRLFGTNPISIAVPNPLSSSGKPFLLDMATSVVPNGKFEIASREEKEIVEGWGVDNNGNPSTNPNVLKNGGSILPLGSDEEHSVHKGYGLGAVVDILTGVLSGANFSTFVPPFVSFLAVADNLPGKGIGHFVGAMKIDAFTDEKLFYKNMKLWSEQIKNAETFNSNKSLKIHGEPEFEKEEERIESGIPLNPKVGTELKELAITLKIKTNIFDNF